jgi:hypothetical protein
VRYLGQFDIRIDDPEFFGTGTAFRQQVTWPTRRVSVAEWRRERAGP